MAHHIASTFLGHVIVGPRAGGAPLMAHHIASTFINVTVHLDGEEFENCTFTDCVLVYSGGPLPKLSGCDLRKFALKFDGPAERTVAFLKLMAAPGSGLQKIVVDTFPALRGN